MTLHPTKSKANQNKALFALFLDLLEGEFKLRPDGKSLGAQSSKSGPGGGVGNGFMYASLHLLSHCHERKHNSGGEQQ